MEQTSEYATMTKDEFKKYILMSKPKSRCQLVYFILNTLHNIIEAPYLTYYCYCQSQEKWKICTIPIIFRNFEKDIENNIFDCNFLLWYYTKLCNELIQLFDQKKDCIESFQGDYEFSGRDWNTDEYWSVPFSKIIQYNGKIQIDRLKRGKLLIPPEFLEI